LIVNETPISESDKKTISPEKTQYKAIQEKTVAGDKVFTLVDLDDKDPDRSLAESAENIGFLEEVELMADGKTVIDGFHRLAANPNWPKKIIPTVTTEKQRLFRSLVRNGHRRTMTAEEHKQIASELAYKQGVTFEEYKKNTGFGHTTCAKYFPKELQHLNPIRAQAGIASGKARALKATQQTQSTTDSTFTDPQVNAPDIANPKEVTACSNSNEKEPELISDKFVPSVEQNQSQEPTNEEKINALNAEADREQQQLEKLICDATADLPNDFKRAVYDLAVNPAKELTQKRLNECLTVTLEVLLDFIEQEGTLQELLKTASERW
jgi:hypothetical protein